MITKLGPKRYRVRIYHAGREIYSRVHDTSAAAKADEASWASRLAGGSWVDPKAGRLPLGKVIDQFLETRPGLVAPKTFVTETYLMGLVSPSLRRLPLGLVESADIAAELARHSMTHSRSTLDRLKSVLSMAFKYAATQRLTDRNPVKGVRTPQGRTDTERTEMWPYSLDELRAVAASLTAVHPDGDIALFLGLTGLRWGELAALRPRDVLEVPHRAVRVARSLSTGQAVKETKNGRVRLVPIVGEAWAVLEARLPGLAPNDLIFSTQGRPLGGWAWKSRVRWAEHAQGRRVHDLRHTAATLWLGSGMDVKTVQNWLGHVTASMTLDRYSHYLPGAAAAGLARMEAVLNTGTGTSPAHVPALLDTRRAGEGR